MLLTNAKHTAALLETHTIVTGFADCGQDVAHAACKWFAEQWADAHGLDITDLSNLVRPSDGTAGVTFTVTVGKGDISDDQRVPGALDSWRWSARMDFWRALFNRADRRQGRILARREDGLASVTTLPGRARAGTGTPPLLPNEDALHEMVGEEIRAMRADRRQRHLEQGHATETED